MGRSISILLIDDDEDQHRIVKNFLTRLDAWESSLTWASSYREGLKVLQQGQYDVCLTDFRLGDRSGIELIREATGAGMELPFILMTGYGDRRVDVEAMRAGAVDYLVKDDLSPALLERAVRYAVGRAIVLRDLKQRTSELEESHRLLGQTAKMASLGQLAAGIAHEINNPLSFVISNVHTVCRRRARLAGAQPTLAAHLEKDRSLLEDCTEGLERIRDLVTKLRTFSRMDEGVFRKTDIHVALNSVLRLLRHKLKGRVTVDLELDKPSELVCAEGELIQVFINVISNAAEAIEGEGRIRIRMDRTDGHCNIRISDTGGGIATADLEKVREPFFTTKPVGQGTGLGLSISDSIVRSHGGTLDIESAEGGGTQVTIRIPTTLTESGEA